MQRGTCNRRELLSAGASLALLAAAPRARKREIPASGKPVKGMESFDGLMQSFLREHEAPGAALAVSRNQRLIYARGFGYADVEAGEPVQPAASFRIASLSKPLSAVAVLQLLERSKHDLDDRLLEIVELEPHLADGATADPRWRDVTLRHLLQHTFGLDRDATFDPIARPAEIAGELGVEPPPRPEAIARYTLGMPLDFDPGTRYAYSNVGYLILGRFIETVAKQGYEAYVKENVLARLGIARPCLGKALLADRRPGEVKYYCTAGLRGPALFGPDAGEEVPVQYGHDNLEGFEAHGGWIASAPDLVRFAADLDEPNKSKLLKADSIETMWRRPKGQAGYDANGKALPVYYGCGWQVRQHKDGINTWHTGYIAGSSTLLVRRWDGLNWAVLFNADKSNARDKPLAELIDPLVHQAAAEVRDWPEHDLFNKLLGK